LRAGALDVTLCGPDGCEESRNLPRGILLLMPGTSVEEALEHIEQKFRTGESEEEEK